MVTGQIPRTPATVLRRLQALDSATTKVADRGAAGNVVKCRAPLDKVARILTGLSVSSAGNRRGVPLFLVKFPDGTPDGDA
jgi:hypothetical protein